MCHVHSSCACGGQRFELEVATARRGRRMRSKNAGISLRLRRRPAKTMPRSGRTPLHSFDDVSDLQVMRCRQQLRRAAALQLRARVGFCAHPKEINFSLSRLQAQAAALQDVLAASGDAGAWPSAFRPCLDPSPPPPQKKQAYVASCSLWAIKSSICSCGRSSV